MKISEIKLELEKMQKTKIINLNLLKNTQKRLLEEDESKLSLHLQDLCKINRILSEFNFFNLELFLINADFILDFPSRVKTLNILDLILSSRSSKEKKVLEKLADESSKLSRLDEWNLTKESLMTLIEFYKNKNLRHKKTFEILSKKLLQFQFSNEEAFSIANSFYKLKFKNTSLLKVLKTQMSAKNSKICETFESLL